MNAEIDESAATTWVCEGGSARHNTYRQHHSVSLNLNFDQASSAATGRRDSNRRSGDSGNEKQVENGESALGVLMRISSRVGYGKQNRPAVYMSM